MGGDRTAAARMTKIPTIVLLSEIPRRRAFYYPDPLNVIILKFSRRFRYTPGRRANYAHLLRPVLRPFLFSLSPPNHRFCQRGICIAKRPPPSFCSTLPRKLQKSCTGLGYLFVWRRFTISGTTPYDWRPIFSTRRWYVRFRTQFTRVS